MPNEAGVYGGWVFANVYIPDQYDPCELEVPAVTNPAECFYCLKPVDHRRKK
jgi:hypothetical protein